ncbi:MAG: GGDEF domain-containing protein, partial [Vibrio sp.]
ALRYEISKSNLDISKPVAVKLEALLQFSEYEEDGQVKGIAADLLHHICAILDLQCQITSQADEPWANMYQDLLDNKIDVLGPITKSTHLEKKLYFSDTFYRPKGILVKRKGYKPDTYRNVSELIIERIGVIDDDFYDRLFTKLLPNKELYRATTRKQQIEQLIDGKVDYIVLNENYYNQITRDTQGRLPIEKAELVGDFYQSELAFGFPKTKRGETLDYFFDRALKVIDAEPIIHAYDIKPDWHSFLESQNRFSLWLRILSALVIAGLVLISWYLYHQSMTDNLTKLKTRRGLYRYYTRNLDPKKTLVYLDVNHFKQLNDNFGHEVGDEVLKVLAQKIHAHWPGSSYRIGGDEFILISKGSEKVINAAIEKLRCFDFYRHVDKQTPIVISLSIGISRNRDKPMPIDDVMHLADVAMYHNKRQFHKS